MLNYNYTSNTFKPVLGERSNVITDPPLQLSVLKSKKKHPVLGNYCYEPDTFELVVFLRQLTQ